MNFDIEGSIENRDLEFEQAEAAFLYKDFLEGYKQEIHKMAGHSEFKRDDTYHSIKSEHHIMYKFCVNEDGDTELYSNDGNRAYEFLIELDVEQASYGIYYGCRGLVKGGDQKEQNRIFAEEWEELKYEITEVLNNTFQDKDFSKRFRMTDNANNKTYWPFWIMLYDDESVMDVAALAVKLICNVYRRYLNGGTVSTKPPKSKTVTIETNFTEKDFNSVLKKLKNIKLFLQFIENAVKCGYLVKDDRYEFCYRFMNMDDGTAAYVLRELSYMIGETKPTLKGEQSVENKDYKIPWSKYVKIFMTSNSNTISNLKQSKNQANQDAEDKGVDIFKKIMSLSNKEN